VWRRVPSGVDVVLVHRPAYDDWALPKGKLEPGETDEEAALREVREETGLSCRLGTELPSTTYADGQGRPKVVRYWTMTVVPGTATPVGGMSAPEASHGGAKGAAAKGAAAKGAVASAGGDPVQGGTAGPAGDNRVMGDATPGDRLTPEPKARQEIDEAVWAPLAEARGRLSYPRDVVVLDALSDFLSQSDVRR
jgi:ADP-ribose pyrophosphatase YjhB (NUDIX family)